ncbi:tellurite resistance TerB family protein [Portibacter marinus]|uniref:tellurite resistance TerB family protein n=1 Tax=Portibacter marinus TaxID=2898660 RepID=UPI001F3CFAF3|nr:TerB family tellurite resistance protein [Portibacter marinus]
MNWNQEEFIAYLLIYASYADGEFSPEERQLILEKVSNESFHRIMAEFSLDTEDDRLRKIKEYEGVYYPTSDQKQELRHMVRQLFYSDKVFSDQEKKMWDRLSKII